MRVPPFQTMAEDDPKRLPFPTHDPRPRRAVVTPDGVSTFEISSDRKYPPGTRVFELCQEPPPWRIFKDETGASRSEPAPPDPALIELAEGLGEYLADLVKSGRFRT